MPSWQHLASVAGTVAAMRQGKASQAHSRLSFHLWRIRHWWVGTDHMAVSLRADTDDRHGNFRAGCVVSSSPDLVILCFGRVAAIETQCRTFTAVFGA